MFSLVFSATIGLFNPGTISAIQCDIIRLNPGGEHTVKIEPPGMMMQDGDCVVWFNATTDLVKVTLTGKNCSSAIGVPVGFVEDNECFSTDWMPVGATGSMQLKERGTYEFTVETKFEPGKKVKGTINVE